MKTKKILVGIIGLVMLSLGVIGYGSLASIADNVIKQFPTVIAHLLVVRIVYFGCCLFGFYLFIRNIMP